MVLLKQNESFQFVDNKKYNSKEEIYLNKFLTNAGVRLFSDNHAEKMTLFYAATLILALAQEFHTTKLSN